MLKVKFSLHLMKYYDLKKHGRNGSMGYTILKLSTCWRRAVTFILLHSAPKQAAIGMHWTGVQVCPGGIACYGEEKNILPLLEIKL
jgi:hypothetical protein